MPEGEESVVFVFQGPGIEGLVRDLVNDPARSAAFSVWAPLLEGLPCSGERKFFWEARPVTVKVARIGSLLVFMVSSDIDSSPAKVRVLQDGSVGSNPHEGGHQWPPSHPKPRHPTAG